MMAAITAAKKGHSVTLLEKNDILGKKLSLTGGGRCNLTYATDPEGLIRNVAGNPTFLYSAFYTFGSESLMSFFEGLGVPLKVEDSIEGGRVFPRSDRAQDIIDALADALAEYKVEVLLNYPVEDIGPFLDKGSVVVATGGLSYSRTGSTGDGYKFAKKYGHNVTDLRPALAPLAADTVGLAGLSLKGVRVSVSSFGALGDAVGDMIFTHKGISGPVVLDVSRYVESTVGSVAESTVGCAVEIDFMPYTTLEELDKQLVGLFKENPNKDIENILKLLLPKRLASFLSSRSALQKAHETTKEARAVLARDIKKFRLSITGPTKFSEAMITAGGINVKEINPSTMASKKVPGLYFAGEVVDVDALTGGFNLQIAFSTGYLAGISV